MNPTWRVISDPVRQTKSHRSLRHEYKVVSVQLTPAKMAANVVISQ